jgi:hypothetical protein
MEGSEVINNESICMRLQRPERVVRPIFKALDSFRGGTEQKT